ncbi:uncharacterized protein MONOS_16074 [Monocercomonoides exilis]|uniref:uncharacterized protein n=1 Tax=Monocercomonoides exilis TaxID=2049356 RepID=UPI00355A7334|nr:hypothetical protein MONOS_16074 [Monocercomonoides exilis]|eukprot:MONOS_16074.1-p1 / transcript=MONOS_16074.1 / gene=MONOS_16074 / organism=Monocercomonoides_exilis_PA203 / gene_product=unspecified product / transcript_product=unspecified product / location=Mono_scaffold01492:8190-8873(+) / protein_length=228 / sequence_SO=supercontig / SO=protein_coding / is_pseudo=false
MRKEPVYAAVDARQTRMRLDLMSALKSVLRQSPAELRRGRGMKWRGWWPYKEEAEVTHRKGRKGAGKGSPLLFQEKGTRTFSQNNVPGRRDALSFSKLVSFSALQNSTATDLMKKYTDLNMVAPFDSDADLAANTNISLHLLSHFTSSLVNSSLLINIQQQSSPSLRTSLSPSQQYHAKLSSSASPVAPDSLSLLSLTAVTTLFSLSFNSPQIRYRFLSFISFRKHR